MKKEITEGAKCSHWHCDEKAQEVVILRKSKAVHATMRVPVCNYHIDAYRQVEGFIGISED